MERRKKSSWAASVPQVFGLPGELFWCNPAIISKCRNSMKCYFMVADLHSLTHASWYTRTEGKCGKGAGREYCLRTWPGKRRPLLPESPAETSELYLYLNTLAYRRAAGKTVTLDKVRQHPENVWMPGCSHPGLQAADIIIHRAKYASGRTRATSRNGLQL